MAPSGLTVSGPTPTTLDAPTELMVHPPAGHYVAFCDIAYAVPSESKIYCATDLHAYYLKPLSPVATANCTIGKNSLVAGDILCSYEGSFGEDGLELTHKEYQLIDERPPPLSDFTSVANELM